MEKRNTVLVLGAGGELGQQVVNSCVRRGVPTLALCHSTVPKGWPQDLVRVVRDFKVQKGVKDKLIDLLTRERVHTVVNCSVCKHDAGQDPELVREFIVDLTVNEVGKACVDTGTKLVQLSTDVVFDGQKGQYEESDPTSPVMWYGECKAVMEQQLFDLTPQGAICCARTSLILTVEPSLEELLTLNTKRSKCSHFCVSRAMQAHSEGKLAEFFTDEIRSVTLADDLADALVALALLEIDVFKTHCSGVLHLVPDESMSRLTLANALLQFYSPQMKTEPPQVQGSLSKLLFQGRRPLNCSLSAARYRALVGRFGLPAFRSVLQVLKN